MAGISVRHAARDRAAAAAGAPVDGSPVSGRSAAAIASRSRLKSPGAAAITSFVRRKSLPPAKSPTRPPASLTIRAPAIDVPRLLAHHPEAVEPPRRDVGEIERAGTGAPDAGALPDERIEDRQVGGQLRTRARREDGADERILEADAGRRPDRRAVVLGALALDRRVELVADRIEHDGVRDVAALGERDRHRVVRDSRGRNWRCRRSGSMIHLCALVPESGVALRIWLTISPASSPTIA